MRTVGPLLSTCLSLCAASAFAQATEPPDGQLRSNRPIPYTFSCGPYLEYQQPLDEQPSGVHASFSSDERDEREIIEATVDGSTIVPVPGAFIDGMRLWGISFHVFERVNCFDDDSVPWNVRFYEDGGAGPGAQVGPTVLAVPVRMDTGLQYFFPNVTLQQFDLTFEPPVDNSAGTISWIGAQRQLGIVDCVFYWIDERTPDFDNTAHWAGSPPLGLHVDMPFCLSLEPIPVELESFEID